ncbi:hypothetical protein EG329_006607 [Mollisiaceae sp. DMI_Dod_QoI]|nr:hypothetical protein EG329_006607 [Helotiales sp. DMI_Dod_QoI]
MVDNNIAGRLALITGASSGIGAACAKDFAGRGVHLALTYSKNKESMEKILSDIKALNSEAVKLRISIHKVDVGNVDEIKNMFTEIQAQHQTHVDILVSNAGYGKRIVDVCIERGIDGDDEELSGKAPLNISVNDVAPALIGETGMISGPDIIPGGTSTIPMKRLGSPQEVANVVTMLATTGFMTGQSLLIAGGLK